MYGCIRDDSKINKNLFERINSNENLLVYNMNDNYSKDISLYELTEFLIKKYTVPCTFEKKDYVTLEKSLYNELEIINDFIKNKTSLLNTINQKKYDLFKRYFNEKKELNSKLKNKNLINLSCCDTNVISDKEKEEIELLLGYKGKKLTKEWEWARYMSIVYILEYYKAESKERVNEIKQLKYSIKSIQKFLPWFEGNIFIIGNGKKLEKEIPWLYSLQSQYHIKLVNSLEIFPSKEDKHSIEMYLDRIPEITERFIVLQPNQFFLNPVHPQFFFSTSFYPKYNFKPIISDEKEEILKRSNNSIIYTYSIIKKYFGKYYVKTRELKNAPFPAYRDLYQPVRQLYTKYIETNKNENNEILPFYLISTYNVYGTEQPFYPSYVTGFGEIMKLKVPYPILPQNRTINYYGFDITSEYVAACTMIQEFSVPEKSKNLEEKIKNLKNSNKLFFSIQNENSKQHYNNYFELLNNLFNE